MSAFEGARADIIWQANTGQAITELGEVGAQYARTTGVMSDEALRLAVAQEKLNKTIARAGPESTSAKTATLAYRRELASLAREENVVAATAARANREQVSASRQRHSALRSEERSAGRFARGGAAGLLSGVGGRALAFGSTAFIGGVGLEYGLRAVTKAAEDHQVAEGQLEAAVTATGLSFRNEREEIEKTLATQQRLGFTYDESVKAFNLALRATGSIAGANRVLSASSDVARGSGRGLLQSTLLVTRAYNGQIGGLRRVGISLKEGSKGYDAVAQAQAKFAGSAETYANSAAGAQARLSVAIHETEVTIGQALLPTITRLSGELATWLNQSKNQQRIQRDVNQIMRTSGHVIHGVVDAFKVGRAVVGPFNHALGGTESTVRLLALAFIGLKLRGFASDLALVARRIARIGIASAAAVPEVEALAAAEAAAGSGVGVGVGGAGAAASGVGLTLAGAAAIYAVPIVAAGLFSTPYGTQVGTTLPGGQGVPIYEQGGKFYVTSPRGGRQEYKGHVYKTARKGGPDVSGDSKITGGQGQHAALLTRGQATPAVARQELGREARIQLALSTAETALARGDKGAQQQVLRALHDEIEFDREYEKEQEDLRRRHIGDDKQHAAILQRLQGDEQSALGQIQSIEDANASKAKTAADKEKSAADKRKSAREKAHRERDKEIRDQLALREKTLRNAVARAKLTKDTLDDDRKALANLIAFDKAQEHNQKLTKSERASYTAKELAARQQLQDLDKKKKTGGAAANEAEFLTSITQILDRYRSNEVPVPAAQGGQTDTHLYDIKSESRLQTSLLRHLASRNAFPASGYALASAEAV